MGFGAISVLFTSPMTILVIVERNRGRKDRKIVKKVFWFSEPKETIKV